MRAREPWRTLAEAARQWSADNAARLAAALAYYGVFSLAPLLVVVIAAVGSLLANDQQVHGEVLQQVRGLIGAEGARAVDTLIGSARRGSGLSATLLGSVALLLGAAAGFGQLKSALDTIWKVEPVRGGGVLKTIRDRLLPFAAVAASGLILLLSLVVSAGLAALAEYLGPLGPVTLAAEALNVAVSLGVFVLLFAAMFRYLPSADVRWRDAWVGGLATALLFALGKEAIGLYLGLTAEPSLYGAAGSVVVLLLWVYYSAQILLFGAEFTRAWGRRHTSPQLAPGTPPSGGHRRRQPRSA